MLIEVFPVNISFQDVSRVGEIILRSTYLRLTIAYETSRPRPEKTERHAPGLPASSGQLHLVGSPSLTEQAQPHPRLKKIDII